MPHTEKIFQIGPYRPIYLWGGPGTIRMNRLKFMNQPVDEAAHHHAHSGEGAQIVLEEMYCNWVHLMYNWGFPPEVEQEDWDDFQRAAAVYHGRGDKVFAYVQTSNCVYDGSFRNKDWYARDPQGKKIFYYSGRFMCCLAHPDWTAHLKGIIRGAIERGADGIFFDNMWHGAMPLDFMGAWLGAAGCHCQGCREAYKIISGRDIPPEISSDDSLVRNYLRYRADQTTALIKELAAYANELQPGTPVSANDYDHFTKPTYVVYGQDIRAMAEVKDVTMIENFALPRWQPLPRPRLANNAMTIRNALASMGDLGHLSVLSYDVGIGFDGVYPARRYQQGIAEAAACGASMTIKGTEYFEDGRHTVLTPAKFAPIQQAIGRFNRWLEANADIFHGGRNLAAVGVFFPSERLWLNWPRLSLIYHGIAQTLTANGIPWRVINRDDSLEGLNLILVLDKAQLDGMSIADSIQVIDVLKLRGWSAGRPSLVARSRGLRAFISRAVHGLMDSYFCSKPVRVIFDGLGLPKIITQSTVFNLPPQPKQDALLAALPLNLYPKVYCHDPVLVELWQRDGRTQLHLVNYAAYRQTIKIEFGEQVEAECLSPDGACESFVGSEMTIDLDIYKIILINAPP